MGGFNTRARTAVTKGHKRTLPIQIMLVGLIRRQRGKAKTQK